MLRGGIALWRRRLPVNRLEYSHADVPVAQGEYAEHLAYTKAATDCDPLSSIRLNLTVSGMKNSALAMVLQKPLEWSSTSPNGHGFSKLQLIVAIGVVVLLQLMYFPTH